MKRLAVPVILLGLLLGPALAQQFTMPPPAGVTVMGCVYNATPPTLTPTASPGMAQCDAQGRLIITGAAPANSSGVPGSINTPVDCSATVVTGGTAVTPIAAVSGTRGFQIMNIDTTEVMWIAFNGTAAASTVGSYPLAPGATTTFTSPGSYYSSIGFTTALSVVAATSGHKFSCTRW